MFVAHVPFSKNELVKECRFSFHRRPCGPSCKACASQVPDRVWYTGNHKRALILRHNEDVEYVGEANYIAQYPDHYTYLKKLRNKVKGQPLPPAEKDVWCIPPQILLAANLGSLVLVPMDILIPEQLEQLKRTLSQFRESRTISELGSQWISAIISYADRRATLWSNG